MLCCVRIRDLYCVLTISFFPSFSSLLLLPQVQTTAGINVVSPGEAAAALARLKQEEGAHVDDQDRCFGLAVMPSFSRGDSTNSALAVPVIDVSDGKVSGVILLRNKRRPGAVGGGGGGGVGRSGGMPESGAIPYPQTQSGLAGHHGNNHRTTRGGGRSRESQGSFERDDERLASYAASLLTVGTRSSRKRTIATRTLCAYARMRVCRADSCTAVVLTTTN